MRIAISGAGVAGPTLAYWLRRAGHAPTLIECAPRLRTGGYVVDFWGAGYRVAQRMGLEERVRSVGYRMRELRSVDDAGRVRAKVSTDSFLDVTSGDFISVPRSELSRVVFESLGDGVETLFGTSISALEQHGKGVRVGFTHGTDREFDLVIGADGLHSNVRRLAFGAQPGIERFLGYHVAAFLAEGYRPRDELVYVTCTTPGAQLARLALRDDRTLVLFVFRSDAGVDPGDEPGRRRLLHAVFGDAGWEAHALLAALDRTDELYFDRVSQIRMPAWSRGRVALVGDAGACVSLLAGEGTGLAMTEAYVLAGELQRAQGDHVRAFRAYEARLRPLVERKQRAAYSFARWFAPRTRLGISLRDLSVQAMNLRPVGRLLAGGMLRDTFVLPDYG